MIGIRHVVIQIADHSVTVSKSPSGDIIEIQVDQGPSRAFPLEAIHRAGDAGRWLSVSCGIARGQDRSLVIDNLRVAAKAVCQIK